ncbi:hypothetical protein ACFL60_04880 [Candidatus Omnitrophota bacterium]
MKNYTNIRHINCCSATFFLLMITVFCLNAQTRDEAFSTVTIGFNTLTNTNRNTFHGFWKPETGYEAYVRVPVQFGSVQFGIQYIGYSAKSAKQPDFKTSNWYILWEKEWRLFPRLSWSAGGRVGETGMDFEKKGLDINPGQLSETEFSAGLHSRLSYDLYRNYTINLMVSSMRIYTRKRINMVHFSAGISRRFNAPGFVEALFK